LETGKLKLEGLTISEAEARISDALIRNNVDPLFQLTVTDFASHHVSLIVPAAGDNPGAAKLFPYTTRPMTLRDLLSAGGIGFDNSKLSVVKLKRAGKTYSMPLERVFEARSPDYYLRASDVVEVEAMEFAPANAYLSVSTGTPVTFPLKSEVRETLADMLFVEGGPLSERTARLSEIYLLRGRNPISAYHLDAEDVTRLAVAREVELRPGDVVFVSDKPVYSAVEFLAVLNPFRALAGGL
jgi:polysaccharide export outer membrane protein